LLINKFSFIKKHWISVLVLLIGGINGGVFVFLVPPWQHYDEPAQFEFAWLIANKDGKIESDDYDQNMRRELVASMIEYGFYEELGAQPNLLVQNQKIDIGFSQVNKRWLYYGFIGLLLKAIPTSDILLQLYLGRLLSLALFAVSLFSSARIAHELTPEHNPLRWMLPLTIALLPGFVDIMTAVNDDVGATAFFSLFLWAGVLLIKKGFSWIRFFGLLVTALICFWMKNTVTIAVILLLIPLLHSVFRDSKRFIAWSVTAVSLVLLLLNAVNWGDAAYWYRATPQERSSRAASALSKNGKHAFRIALSPVKAPPRLVQLIPENEKENLLEQPITIGAWIWASEPGKVRTPILVTERRTYSKLVSVSTDPEYYSITINLAQNNLPLSIVLAPKTYPVNREIEVFYDGVVLTTGNHSSAIEPQFADSRARSGMWNEEPFENVVRNGSAESPWPWIDNWADRLLTRNFPGRPSLFLTSILDIRVLFPYYINSLARLLQTFWGQFGWGHIPLVVPYSYRVLALITLVGLVGGVISLIRSRHHIPWDILFFLGVSLVLIWASALMRGTGTLIDGRTFLPVARYAYPVIIPTMLVLNIGWLCLIHDTGNLLRIPKTILLSLLIVFFLILDVVGWISIAKYYS
jgi:hypothetical protein